LGVVPVVETSSLDALYSPLPVLIVNDIKNVTRELLEEEYERFEKRVEDTGRVEGLWRKYYYQVIEGYRKEALLERGMGEAKVRRRCWGKT